MTFSVAGAQETTHQTKMVKTVAAAVNEATTISPVGDDDTADSHQMVPDASDDPYVSYKGIAPEEFAVLAWEAYAAGEFDKVDEYTGACIAIYGDRAAEQQAMLRTYPTMSKADNYAILNSVGTCHYIRGEVAMNQEHFVASKNEFITIIENYSFSQCWDPRGWFWKITEKAIVNLTKIAKQSPEAGVPAEFIQEDAVKKKEPLKQVRSNKPVIIPELRLYEPGDAGIVDYTQFGAFSGEGTAQYTYRLKKRKDLAAAVGSGVYPNTQGITKDPVYLRLKKEGALTGSHWDHIRSGNSALDFYTWALAPEEKGVRQFYTSVALEDAGLIAQAIRSYYSIVIHFPRSIGWTYWHTPWSVAQAAIDKIDFLTRRHPELGIALSPETRVRIKGGYNNEIADDEFIVSPGKLEKVSWIDRIKALIDARIPRAWKLDKLKTVEQRVSGRVSLNRLENRHWLLKVDDKPFFIRAVAYSCSPIGQSPDNGTLQDWMTADTNNNGKIDGPYDSWVDANLNNRQDAGEGPIGDFALLQQMGCNTLRLYHHAANKELLRDAYNNYGMMVLMGDLLGAYAVGSGASWYRGTEYDNPEHQKNMLEGVKKMVMAHKDEPYLLMWVLGNENNYGVANNAKRNPRAFYRFANDVAKWIKSVDPNHPVAICVGDLLFLDIFAEECPDIDVYGSNAYRGNHGFGRSFWQNILEECDKPVIITEYGCPAHMGGADREVAEEAQADYLRGCLEDLEYHSAGGRGFGNSLGGVLFEWMDEWWKAYEPMQHDITELFSGPFPDGFMHEEWLGVVSQGDGSDSPFMRQLRKAYFLSQEIWSRPWA